MEPVDEHFIDAVTASSAAAGSEPELAPASADLARSWLRPLYDAQIQSRHLDFAARWLQKQGRGYYTIGSAGHEANAALGLLSEVTDPALLHYRSGGFYTARAAVAGTTDPVRDVLCGLSASTDDPISGGRHKVFGHPDLHVIPQTSTIASHGPRAVGLGFALGLARDVGRRTPWPEDAVVVCSFGDASMNHSTMLGALNTAGYLRHRSRPCPVLFVCEDNGIGISTPTPTGWPEAMLRTLPHVPYFAAEGTDPVGLLSTVADALETVRRGRSPAVLHLAMVRFMGHAGSDAEIGYRSRSAITADFARDPLVHTARVLIEHGLANGEELLRAYEQTRGHVRAQAETVLEAPHLADRAAVVAPLAYPADPAPTPPPSDRTASEPESAERLTLAQAINVTLAEVLAEHPETLVFGEDVGRKGGVYGVTRGLQRRFGSARVFDTLLDEQTILGTALGTSLAGFLPVPEIQYLAYVHNAEDQLRGEAASLRFFSNGQYQNGMVVRIAGLAYQRGFGGHFHNDNSLAVLRDIPGIVVAVPSHPAEAPGLVRSCIDLARDDGRVCVVVEPIALYHTRDLVDGDSAWTAPYVAAVRTPLGSVATYGTGSDILIVTFGNGVRMSRRAAITLAKDGIDCTVLDLRWLTPLPIAALSRAVDAARAVLIVDETRASGGVGEAIAAALVDQRSPAPIARITSADSYIPLGPAADTVLLQEADIRHAARAVIGRDPATAAPPGG